MGKGLITLVTCGSQMGVFKSYPEKKSKKNLVDEVDEVDEDNLVDKSKNNKKCHTITKLNCIFW